MRFPVRCFAIDFRCAQSLRRSARSPVRREQLQRQPEARNAGMVNEQTERVNEWATSGGRAFVTSPTGAGVVARTPLVDAGRPVARRFCRGRRNSAPPPLPRPPKVSAPPRSVTSATPWLGLGRGARGRGPPGPREGRPKPAPKQGLHFPRGLGGGSGGGRGDVPRKWSPGLPLVRETSGAGDKSRGRTRDLTRWPGCPAGSSR